MSTTCSRHVHDMFMTCSWIVQDSPCSWYEFPPLFCPLGLIIIFFPPTWYLAILSGRTDTWSSRTLIGLVARGGNGNKFYFYASPLLTYKIGKTNLLFPLLKVLYKVFIAVDANKFITYNIVGYWGSGVPTCILSFLGCWIIIDNTYHPHC